MVMMLAMSIVFGFKKEIRNKVTGFDSQVTIYPASYGADDRNDYVDLSPELESVIRETGLFDTPVLVIRSRRLLRPIQPFRL